MARLLTSLWISHFSSTHANLRLFVIFLVHCSHSLLHTLAFVCSFPLPHAAGINPQNDPLTKELLVEHDLIDGQLVRTSERTKEERAQVMKKKKEKGKAIRLTGAQMKMVAEYAKGNSEDAKQVLNSVVQLNKPNI